MGFFSLCSQIFYLSGTFFHRLFSNDSGTCRIPARFKEDIGSRAVPRVSRVIFPPGRGRGMRPLCTERSAGGLIAMIPIITIIT